MFDLGAGIVLLGQSVVMTQPICQGYAEIAYELENTYNETMIAEKAGPQGSMLQYWENSEAGSYIVVLKKSGDVGCILEFGMGDATATAN